MDIKIGKLSEGPIYMQVRTQIEARIKDKEIKSGEALPAPSMLAQKLAVDKGEIQRAYFELVQHGLVTKKTSRDFLGQEKTTYVVN
jgi:DNA-binding transcriptional regulator YhcF (GntR family)